MNKENHAGKGDTPRKVDMKLYGENYESIFRRREALACKGGNYSPDQEAEFYQAHDDFARAVADVCHRCDDCDCQTDPDHDSHDETTYP
jgi:hypothetical protein